MTHKYYSLFKIKAMSSIRRLYCSSKGGVPTVYRNDSLLPKCRDLYNELSHLTSMTLVDVAAHSLCSIVCLRLCKERLLEQFVVMPWNSSHDCFLNLFISTESRATVSLEKKPE